MNFQDLKKKIIKKNAKISILGLGYVGLPVCYNFAKKGFKVIGFDNDLLKINQLKKGNIFSNDIKKNQFLNLIKKKQIFLTNKSYFLKEADVYIICVPTPLGKAFAPDISFIDNAVKTIIKNFKEGSLVILESTCHPGCTRENVKKIFEKNNYVLSKDVFISYSPERIDPGNKIFNLSNTTKVIGSDCNKSLFLSKSLYSQIINKIFTLNSFDEAEMSKLIENVYRQVNIALINELAKMSEKLSINIWNTIKASSTKPYGFSTFFPGPGTGGHCIPLDPMYLFWRAKSKNFHSRFIKTANEINLGMPDYVVNRVLKILPKKFNNTKILIIGIAYKKDIGDYREAPSLKIFEKLLSFGFKVSYHDNYINELNIKYKKKIKKFKSKKINKSILENSDLIIVLTNHSYINWKIIKKYSKKIFDTRNVFKKKDNKIILI